MRTVISFAVSLCIGLVLSGFCNRWAYFAGGWFICFLSLLIDPPPRLPWQRERGAVRR